MSQRTYEHLAALRDALQYLNDALVPGTPRRWAERDLTAEQRASMDRRAVEEREAKLVNLASGIKALGDGRAPLRLDVLDIMADIAVSLPDLEEAVCEQLGLTPLERATTAERILRLVNLLDRIDLYEDLAEHVHAEALRLRWQVAKAIGDVEQIRKLKFRCHICDANSMRAFPERELIICVNGDCRCNADDCPCQWERPVRHRWTFNEWPWLATLLDEGIGDAEGVAS
ncbi:hypothetical protein ACGFNP_25360 [Nonomuraea sp. NPDC049269]|uniref:hypothetical protein n=1 Tax=Nonomuraea sp. NPDC049269 TaxID=3364349 RepID=UPI0037244047